MNVFVTHEQRFVLGEDGAVYTENEHASGYSFFQRYLEVFETVTVVGRLAPGADQAARHPVTGPGVRFAAIPHYLGPWQYLRKAGAVRKAIGALCARSEPPSAYIARTPGTLGSILIDHLTRSRHPYAMEVLGDPYEAFRPGAVKHPLRAFFRAKFTLGLKRQCRGAGAVAYVTRETLQRRYPAACGAFSTHYSSIDLEASAIAPSPRCNGGQPGRRRLVFVGSLAQMYKGVDVLLEAVHLCRSAGIDLEVEIIGDGKCRAELSRHAHDLGLADCVHFRGALPSGGPVREHLDRADLFVLPSMGEGLPRALIEAMARGLPCIATAVGGIPELLPAEDLVPPGDAPALASRLRQVLGDPARMQAMAARNLGRVRDYESGTLQRRRNEFYARIRALTRAYREAGPT